MNAALFSHYAVPLCLVVCLIATVQCLGVARTRWRAGCRFAAVNVSLSIIALWINFSVIVYMANLE